MELQLLLIVHIDFAPERGHPYIKFGASIAPMSELLATKGLFGRLVVAGLSCVLATK